MTQSDALRMLKTGANVFLTGEPGSGKTHTINEYIRYLKNAKVDVAVTASTGIAATHLGGMTIHSWSGIGIKKQLTDYDVDRIASNERIVKRMQKTKVLVIDEISMLDGVTLNSIDRVCREIKEASQPFGGLQVILVGDFFQLPPVTREGEDMQFSFLSDAFVALNPLICYLSEQHRQADTAFLQLLTAWRRNELDEVHLEQLNSRRLPISEEQASTIPKLYSHNTDVDRMNDHNLQKIPGDSKTFSMARHGKDSLVEQLQRGCLSPEKLTLKKGAVVMFTKNSPKGLFVNGTLGEVIGFNAYNRCPVVKTKSDREVTAEPMDWTVEDNGRVLARISQIPLRLAWALTIHKSQGTSLDTAYIDLRDAFVAGQGYVALSRVRTLNGLFLGGYNEQALQVHPLVLEHDQQFRHSSSKAGEEFAKLSSAELKTMHRNFIKASGGKIPKEGKQKTKSPSANVVKIYSVEKLRLKYPNAYRSWRADEDKSLTAYHKEGKKMREVAVLMGRQPGAIYARLTKLGLF